MCVCVGLVMASIVVDLTGAAQPALLYLVPSTLIPLLLKASIQVCVHMTLCVCVFKQSFSFLG